MRSKTMSPSDTPGPELDYRQGWNDCVEAVRELLKEHAKVIFWRAPDEAIELRRMALQDIPEDPP
jgi:hypothetical protein